MRVEIPYVNGSGKSIVLKSPCSLEKIEKALKVTGFIFSDVSFISTNHLTNVKEKLNRKSLSLSIYEMLNRE